MQEKYDNGILTVFLSGKIDTTNAANVGSKINEIRAKYPDAELILDIEDVQYVSSAGLRVFLHLRKIYPNLEIRNANSDVYDVLDMTGMSEMMKVTKAFRRLSVDGCSVIGEGSNGKVYRYDSDIIVKVYRNPDCLPEIQRERELARKAFVLGIPTAIPYDIVKVGDSYGSVFELLDAQSLSEHIVNNPEKTEEYVDQFVSIVKKLHSTVVKPTDMPDMKAVAVGWAEYARGHLPRDEGDKLVSLVSGVPECHTMLHGDYHTNNLLMQGDEALLIDMDTLCFGHPVFELASMYLAFRAFGDVDPDVVTKFLKMPYETAGKIWNMSLKKYFDDASDDRIREVEEKAMIIAYTRLLRRTLRRIGTDSEEGRKTVENCRSRLSELLPRVDTLDF